MTLVELTGLRDHLARCRAAGMRGTLHAEVKRYIAELEQAKRADRVWCGLPTPRAVTR